MKIGKRIRAIRKAKKMTLEELSEASGVALATLSRVENERMNGTIDSHMAIAKALGKTVAELYTDVEAETKEIDLQKQPERTDVFVRADNLSYEMLTRNILNKKMMPIMLKIPAGEQINPKKNPVGTEKFVYVLNGRIEVSLRDKNYTLSNSDTLYFDGSLKHQFKNIGKSLARAICIISPPIL